MINWKRDTAHPGDVGISSGLRERKQNKGVGVNFGAWPLSKERGTGGETVNMINLGEGRLEWPTPGAWKLRKKTDEVCTD